jgi:hypothetical protein
MNCVYEILQRRSFQVLKEGKEEAMEPTILVRVTVQEETATQVAEALAEIFKSLGATPTITVTAAVQKGRRLIVIDTRKPYTDEAASDIFSQTGYDAIYQMAGVLTVEIVSSDVERPTAMTQVEANDLSARMMREAHWIGTVSVRPAHEVNDDFSSEEPAFVCWIEGRTFQAEIYNATEWATLMERLDYEDRMSAFIERLDEPDARPFRRYVLDSPSLPIFGSYTYLELERHAIRNYLLDAALPPWRSAVRSKAGARAIYAISGVRVPVSVAPFGMKIGDQALVVTPEGEIGLLIREK